MSNLTIFKDQNAVSTVSKRSGSALSQTLAQANTMRRIATNTNGTFKRIVNGEQVGNAIRGEFNCIIVDALPKVSRTFYAGKYDPNAKPTLPDCWSNLGDKPEAGAPNKQAKNCADCAQNIKGSGENGGRACRFQRRIAIQLVGDPTGEVYQFNVPAKSLFGKGNGNVHPFESYVKYLLANGEAPDTVVTNISYDLNADSMELLFTPLRGLTDEEYDRVVEAQSDPDTKKYIQLTVAQADGTTAKPQAQAQTAPQFTDEPEEEEPAPAPKVVRSDEPDDEDEVIAEPVKRSAAKSAPAVTPAAKADLASVLTDWADDEDA